MGGIIEGVSLHPLKQISVPKGDLWHAFKSTDEGFVGFGEAYFTQIKPHEVKGWKRHNRYVLNLVVAVGSVKFVIYDDREGSSTYGQFEDVVLSAKDNYKRMTIAPGLWMAFQGVGDGISMLMDVIPDIHTDEESTKKELNSINYSWS